jgi:predicted CXXCH cytochrome family protein
MVVPALYPLDWNNELTCSSCHNIHDPVHGLLRGDARGRNFCLSCHDTGFFERMADMGSSLIISGHLSATTTQISDLVDPFSLQCMGCHDEKGEIPIGIDINGITRHAGNGLNHPIGNNYTAAASSGGLHPQAMLNPSIDLPEGRVSCISCHSGYSAQHGLVKSVSGRGGLCLECHDL